jgi:hypothetical protein
MFGGFFPPGQWLSALGQGLAETTAGGLRSHGLRYYVLKFHNNIERKGAAGRDSSLPFRSDERGSRTQSAACEAPHNRFAG